MRFGQFARQQHGGDRDHVARGFPGPAAARRAVGVERLDLVADAHGFAQVLGAAGDADAHLIGLIAMRRETCGPCSESMPIRSNAQFAGGNARQFQPLAHDVERQSAARERTRTGIGDLALADEAVDIADRDLQRVGALWCHGLR